MSRLDAAYMKLVREMKPFRDRLDTVREVLRLPRPAKACLLCGSERAADGSCPMCGGKPVRVRNLVAALDEALHPTKGSVGHAERGSISPERQRQPGTLDVVELANDGRTRPKRGAG